MKQYLLISVVFIFFIQQSRCSSYSTKCVDNKVDSLFTMHFKKMNNVFEKNLALGDNVVDRKFVYLLTYFSGIGCKTIDYTGFCYFSRKELDLWEEWYEKNKCKIKWEEVELGLEILGKKNISDIDFNKLDSLKIN